MSQVTWNQSDLSDPTQWSVVINNSFYLLYAEGASQSLSNFPPFPSLFRPYISIVSEGESLIINSAFPEFSPSTNAQDALTFYTNNTSAITEAASADQLYMDIRSTPTSFKKVMFYYMVNGWPSSGTITVPSQYVTAAQAAVNWVDANFPNFSSFSP